MHSASRVRRGDVTLAAIAFAAVALFDGRSALASEPVEACIAIYGRYETRLAAGDLLGAKSELARCGASSCPGALQRECVTALASLEPRIPTVVLVAHDTAKHDLTDVRVALDGSPLRSQLDGREIPLNPGPHRFRFDAAGAEPVEQTVLVREREKGRIVEAQLAPRAMLAPMTTATDRDADRDRERGGYRAADASAPRTVPTLSWILGGVGVAALGTSAVFGATALSARSDANRCRPDCTAHQVDAVNERLLGADVALGVSVVSLAAAVIVYFAQPATRPPLESSRR